jgi:hypothetical protein
MTADQYRRLGEQQGTPARFPQPKAKPDMSKRSAVIEPLVSSPGVSPMQRTREDGFSGSTDPWAHGQRPSTPSPLQ